MATPTDSTRQLDLASLPLFAQALVASRIARRAVLAMLTDPEQSLALAACDRVDAIAREGGGWRKAKEPAAVRTLPRSRATEAALEAVRWAFDSVGAAEGALDFPVDATVTASATRAVDAVRCDLRVSPLQLAIVFMADVDQIAFACSEIRLGKYDALTPHVFGRLAPCHAITLIEPTPTAEELAR